jgi:Histidine kinase
MKKGLLLIGFCLCCHIIFGQSIFTKQLTVKDGLASNTVYDVITDRNGLVWLATDCGLCTYDGTNFKHYTTNDGLVDNVNYLLFEDDYGRIWMSASNGKLCYYQNGLFYSAANDPKLRFDQLPNAYVRVYLKNDDSSFYINYLTSNKVLLIKKNSVESIKTVDKNVLYYHKIKQKNRLLEEYYFSDDSVIDRSFKIETNLVTNEVKKQLASEGPYVLKYKDGWYMKAFLESKLLLFYRQLDTFRYTLSDELASSYIYSFCFSHQQEFYVGTSIGIFKFDHGAIKKILKDPVNAICKLENDVLVFSTLNDGIFIFSNNQFQSQKKLSDQLYKNWVQEIDDHLYLQDHTKLWDAEKNQILFDYEKLNARTKVNPIQFYAKPYLYFSVDTIIIKHNLANNTFKQFSFSPNLHYSRAILVMDSTIILNRRNCLMILSEKNNSTVMKLKHNLIFGISTEEIYKVKKLNPKEVIVLTNNGLYKVDIISGVISVLFNSKSYRDIAILDSTILFKTDDSKLKLFSLKTNTFICKQLDSIDKSVIVKDIYPARDNQFVFRTTKGIYQISFTKNNQFILKKHFLNDLNFLSNVVQVMDSSIGILYDNDWIKCPISKAFASIDAPKLAVQYVKSQGKILTANQGSYTLNYNNNCVIFLQQYLINPDDFKFSYTFNNQDWIAFDGKQLNFNLLEYGNYPLTIKAVHKISNISNEMQLKLNVLPPFYATKFAWFCWMLALILLFYFLIKYFLRRNNFKKQQELDQSIRILKSEFMAVNSMMNPHFIFNTINSIQLLISKQKNNDAFTYLNKLSRLIRKNVKNLANELISLEDELDIIDNYIDMEKLRFKQLKFIKTIDPEILLDEIKLPPLTIQPLIENALKHGFATTNVEHEQILKLDIYYHGDTNDIFIEIIDNGIGADGQQQGLSLGIQSIQDRLYKMKAMYDMDLSLQLIPQQVGFGVRVVIGSK